jgi:CarD family transcriptional regulator
MSSSADKTSSAIKPSAGAKSPARRLVSDTGVKGEPAAAGKTSRPAAAAKRSKSGAIKREAADGVIGSRAEAASGNVAASVRPAAKKLPADSALVQAGAVSTPEVIDLIEASKRQAIGDAAAPAASMNSIPTEEEQKRVTKKIEKKTSAESPAIGRRGSDSAVAEAIVSARAAAAREAAPLTVEPTQSEAKSGDKTTVAIAKPVKSSTAPRQGFKPNDFIVYPAHGVGQIVAIEEQEVAGFTLELYVIIFVKDKMILKVPTPKVASVGMRKLAEADVVRKALDTLTGRARIKRTMWSRRAQEYEAKINSGDLISIAEVVRDLYRSDAQPEQSYSERQLYEAALDRMAREVVIVQKLTETETLKAIEAQLQKGPRRGKAEEIEVDDVDADIEEAA